MKLIPALKPSFHMIVENIQSLRSLRIDFHIIAGIVKAWFLSDRNRIVTGS